MKKSINIIITDDCPEFIEGLSLMIDKNQAYVIIDTCATGEQLLKSKHLSMADLLLTDIHMPVLNGIEAAKMVNYYYPHKPQIALTMQKDDIFLYDIICAGYKGFIYKPDVAEKLFKTIDMVLNNEFAFPADLRIDDL